MGSQPALEGGLQFQLSDPPPPGQITISEERRAELMNAMRENERDPEPSRERENGPNLDYRMQNELILRLHQTPSVMWLELLRPATSVSEGSVSLGIVARLQNWRSRSQSEIDRRRMVYDQAKILEPSIEALAAINKTIEMGMLRTPRAAGSTQAPVTPRAQTLRTRGDEPASGSRGRLRRIT